MATGSTETDPVYRPLKFIGGRIAVEFDVPPEVMKKPGCPDRFVWKNATCRIDELISEWQDFHRKGRAAHNMRPEHAASARLAGSRGVGKYYFRVRTDAGKIFDMYYDRAPKDTEDRAGSWFLVSEMVRREQELSS